MLWFVLSLLFVSLIPGIKLTLLLVLFVLIAAAELLRGGDFGRTCSRHYIRFFLFLFFLFFFFFLFLLFFLVGFIIIQISILSCGSSSSGSSFVGVRFCSQTFWFVFGTEAAVLLACGCVVGVHSVRRYREDAVAGRVHAEVDVEWTPSRVVIGQLLGLFAGVFASLLGTRFTL
jgi:hypothetical protein